LPEEEAVTKTVELTMKSIEELKKMPRKCAWDGCRESYLITNGMPKGWRSLLLFRDPEQSSTGFLDVLTLAEPQRDTSLCPRHVKELDALLEHLPLVDPKLAREPQLKAETLS
jgi:hypothetical protein